MRWPPGVTMWRNGARSTTRHSAATRRSPKGCANPRKTIAPGASGTTPRSGSNRSSIMPRPPAEKRPQGYPLRPFRGVRSGRAEQAELLQRGHTIVQADLLRDLAVLDTQHRHSAESHPPAGARRQRPGEEVTERRPRVGAAAFPASDHKVALRDEVRGSREAEVGERLAERHHEGPHVVSTAARRV